jgi:hypothetical protein
MSAAARAIAMNNRRLLVLAGYCLFAAFALLCSGELASYKRGLLLLGGAMVALYIDDQVRGRRFWLFYLYDKNGSKAMAHFLVALFGVALVVVAARECLAAR